MIKPINCDYLKFLTDDFGIWQHTDRDTIHLFYGYALDDAARALIVALDYKEMDLAEVYFQFIFQACCNYERIINFFDDNKNPLSPLASEDAIGEVYWAIAKCIANNYKIAKSQIILEKILPYVINFNSPRGKSYVILGALTIDLELAKKFSYFITAQYREVAMDNWYWPEKYLTYANAIIPWALIESSIILNISEFDSVARQMLNFLNEKCSYQGIPIAIGCKGWYSHQGTVALFCQQPIDPAYQAIANFKANNFKEGELYLQWFWGNNIVSKSLINCEKNSCSDGFDENDVSLNCGAESIICYLLAQAEYIKFLDN